MSDQTPISEEKPVSVEKVKDQLRGWLDSVSEKCACGIGIKNFTGKTFVNPRTYCNSGKVIRTPQHKIEPNTAASALFTKTDYSLKGCAGLVCLDIDGSEFSVCVLFIVPFSETLNENHLALRVIGRPSSVDEDLYKSLQKECKSANGECQQEENGYRVVGAMSRDSKCLLLVDCYEVSKIGLLKISEPIKAGSGLESTLREWLGQTDVGDVCAVGINNYSHCDLHTPKVFIDSGRSIMEPPAHLEPQQGAPCLFAKRQYSLKGTSGVLTYSISGGSSNMMLCVLWSVPYSSVIQENRFNVSVMPTAECNADLFSKLWQSSRTAKDGELERTENGFHMSARMEPDSRCVLVVNIRGPKKAGGWLW